LPRTEEEEEEEEEEAVVQFKVTLGGIEPFQE
jgi:hypothetical protein